MICIYHDKDLDGSCSGAIVKKKFPEVVLIGYDYGQPIPWDKIPEGEPVIMVDVSLPMSDMEKLSRHSHFQFTWIDHHASAIAEYNQYFWNGAEPKAILKDGTAACEIAWQYFFPEEKLPTSVILLSKYDTWKNEDKELWEDIILPFQFGMRLTKYTAETFPQYMLTIIAVDIDAIVEKGEIILRYQAEQNAAAMKGSFVIDLLNYRVLACNNGGFNSQAFESVWDEEKHDIMMPFRYNGKFWTCSLYTTKDIDVSEIAKQLGGGGHRKAAGFQCSEIMIYHVWDNDVTERYMDFSFTNKDGEEDAIGSKIQD
jgi:oligoribonuclease NrnB/cAMP/cGMP phosphodiesterase (DHH superfamily)